MSLNSQVLFTITSIKPYKTYVNVIYSKGLYILKYSF